MQYIVVIKINDVDLYLLKDVYSILSYKKKVYVLWSHHWIFKTSRLYTEKLIVAMFGCWE